MCTVGFVAEKIHEKHSEKGLSCLECHNGARPPVDVVWGDPVGNSRIVCQICHDYEDSEDGERQWVDTDKL